MFVHIILRPRLLTRNGIRQIITTLPLAKSRGLVIRQGKIESRVTPDKIICSPILSAKESRAAIVPLTIPSLQFNQSLGSLLSVFLPDDHQNSVTHQYLPYSKWQFVHNILGAASGVLATQSLLYAMGLGAAGALPLSAAINWVIKDGVGQLGGVVYATIAGTKFDSDPKHLRFWSTVWLQAATWLEMLAPLVPHLFLVVGSVANVGKNVSWLAISATRASINRTFCLKENLGDITAKSGSQATAAGLVGTALGVGVGWVVDASVYTLLAGFVPISVAGLWANYKSLLHVVTPTLNQERAQLMLQDAISFNEGKELRLDISKLRGPKQVSELERFMWRRPSEMVSISASIDKLADRTEMLKDTFAWTNEKYYAGGEVATGHVYLWFDVQATNRDMLCGFYHALAWKTLLAKASPSAQNSKQVSYEFTKRTFPDLLRSMGELGWDTNTMYLSTKKSLHIEIGKIK